MSEHVRVLIVDDNPHDRGLVLRELKRAFAEVEAHQVLDRTQLDEALSMPPFDIVVTDYKLQWTNGIRVLQEVKQCWPECPVIMFTASGSEEVAVDAMKLGLDDYVIKSVSHLVRLRAAVGAAIQNAKVRRRARDLQHKVDALLNRLNLGVFRCGPDGQLTSANRAFERLVGAETSEEAAAAWDRLRLDCPGADQLIASVPRDEVAELEIHRFPGGNEQVCRLSLTRSVTSSGEVIIDGLLEDITARKRAESERQAQLLAAERLAMLSKRERDVFDAVVTGQANKVTARQLQITEKTVEKHRANVMRKLRVRSVAQLVRLDVLAGQLEQPPRTDERPTLSRSVMS